jgi:ribosomal protein S18 acetylase RimI-like enzyme
MIHLDIYEEDVAALKLLEKGGFKVITRQEKFVKEGDRYLARILMNVYL